jgi:hypothetical protein
MRARNYGALAVAAGLIVAVVWFIAIVPAGSNQSVSRVQAQKQVYKCATEVEAQERIYKCGYDVTAPKRIHKSLGSIRTAYHEAAKPSATPTPCMAGYTYAQTKATCVNAQEAIASLQATDSPSPPPAAGAWPPETGQQYVTGTEMTTCSTDDDALNHAMDAAAKNDTEGMEEALAGTLMPVPSDTTVRILNYDVLRGVADMRLNTGGNMGTRVYCVVGTDNSNGFFAKRLSDSDSGE